LSSRAGGQFLDRWHKICGDTERDPLKVATFNINNINKRLDNLLAWLAKAEPDVVSLQELKAEQEAFPVNALRTLGYEAVWQGERSWNGVAILARNQVPVLTCTTWGLAQLGEIQGQTGRSPRQEE
jgi:exonuclease III